MDLTFPAVPAMFGTVHIIILVAAFLFSVRTFFRLRGMTEKDLMRFLFVAGVLMIAAEVWKQWFVHKYVYPDIRSAWFFPWQLCSMAMYCCVPLPFQKGKAQDAVLVFMATFGLIAAVFALAVPGDMMRPQVLLFCHGFLYHILMIQESLACVVILSRRAKAPFKPAAILYAGMAVVAEIVNVASHYWAGEDGLASNMFNITPYWPTTQPVFHEIALKIGIIPEILLYTALIALGALILWFLEYALTNVRRRPLRLHLF
ncbi:MAG: YwaF family protein [Firmicutes bacterium]|nr:YwaF family protein [Bacillota bacterium]